MIDWFTGILPCTHRPLPAGSVVSVDADGAVEWETVKRLTVRGSHESTMKVRSVGSDGEGRATHLYIDGNPSKFLQGHSVIGSDDLQGLVLTAYARILALLHIPHDLPSYRQVMKGQFKISRIDINYMYSLSTLENVRAWLYAAEFKAKTRHGRACSKGGTVYLGKKTTNQSNGGYSTICAVPEKEDYTTKDIDEKSELTIWTNTKYKAMTEVLEAGNIESMIDYLEYLDSVSVSPALLADMINELWSEAAVNADYNGLPFKEVSPAEVTSAMSELRLSPTLLDMLSPVSDSAGADVNIDITINNNSGSDTGNNGNIDLGEDPGVKEPELEETPTARDILTPIINLLPFTNEFNIGSRSASCPVVEFSVFNHQYRIDSHCPLIEQNRSAVETIFLIIWGFVALRIILSA